MRLPSGLHSKITPSGATAIAVFLLPLLYFFPATRGSLILSPDDGIIFNVPLRAVVADLIRSGYLPLWNPYIFCGMPLFAGAQAGVLFPLNWFYLLFSTPVATNLMMLSTYMFAALGAYLYARRSGSSLAGAALTSVVWQCSAFLVGQVGHTNIMHTAALLPWLLWAVDGYGMSGGKRSRGLLLAAIVAFQFFAGHQQTFAYALLVAAAYAVAMWRANQSANTPRPAYLWSLVLIAAGLALAAVQILPTLELLRNSLRADASYDFFSSFSMPRRFLWTFFAPYVMGGGDGYLFRAPYVGPAYYAEYVGYVGLGTITLALLAFGLKRDARITFWVIVVLAGSILALGRYAPFEFYKLIYFVPGLNLFRVPARHLMEVEFALAVLAGRGLTAVVRTPDRSRTLRWVLAAGLVVFVLTCLAITWGRPASFHLGRTAPVTILRAPELFLPPIIAALSAWALWMFARRQRPGTLVLLLTVLLVDLSLWGQSSGWRVSSPTSRSELWSEPAAFQFLREHERQNTVNGGIITKPAPYRVLTQDQFLDPDKPIKSYAPASGWIPALQPDICMTYGWENAAGYDGFGLARYSRLAGDMKVWGDLADAERTLRSESREIDLLNVRYLLARSASAATTKDQSPSPAEPAATQVYDGQTFAVESLNLSGLVPGERLSFKVPPTETDHIALLTALAWSETVPDRTVVAKIRLHGKEGETYDFELRAGDHTSEWAYDRPDIRSHIAHKRAPVASSYTVTEPPTKYEAHNYFSSFTLPRKTIVIRCEITVGPVLDAPQLSLIVTQVSLAAGNHAFPLRSEWITRESGVSATGASEGRSPRWKRIAEVGKVAIFENTRVLPRAWLAQGELVASGEEELGIIRSGKTPAGAPWDPLEKALVESSTGVYFSKEEATGRAEVTRHEPNRVEVKTQSAAPSLLVLAENHYPGWRAKVDGHRTKIMRVNYNQRGVALPKGHHTVSFVYQPMSMLIGLLISLLAIVSLVLWERGLLPDRLTSSFGRSRKSEHD
jgi:hypothetical protein